MAVTFSISATVQDADAVDLRVVLQQRFGTGLSDVQLRTALENELRSRLTAWVVDYRRSQAAVSTPPVT